MTVDPRHFQVLLAIAREGSFNRAANVLGVTQPAVSKSIALLEKALGATLLERGKRGAVLTDAGRIALRSAESIVWAVDKVQEDVAALLAGSQPTLKIGVVPSLALGLFAAASAGNEAADGGAKIVLGDLAELVEALQRGEIDIILGPLPGPSESWPAPSGHVGRASSRSADIPPPMQQIALFTEPFVLAVPADREMPRGDEIDVADLIDDLWVIPQAPASRRESVARIFERAGCGLPQSRIETTQVNLEEALATSMGRLSIVNPSQFIGRRCPFTLLPLAHPLSRTIGVLTPRGRPPSATSARLIDRLGEVVNRWTAEGGAGITLAR